VSHGICLGGAGNTAAGVLMNDPSTSRIIGLLPFSVDDMVFVNETKQ
jgi:hypothetical protein